MKSMAVLVNTAVHLNNEKTKCATEKLLDFYQENNHEFLF